jgi:hypothetical protein
MVEKGILFTRHEAETTPTDNPRAKTSTREKEKGLIFTRKVLHSDKNTS